MYEAEYELAMKAALKAGEFLENNYNPQVDSHIGKDIKLSSDKKSEAIIIEILRATNIPILSEECGMIGADTSSKVWIVDPLDGTANYWKGMKELACVSIALWDNGKPVLGIINRFHQKEVFSGIVGEGAWLNENAIYTSSVTELKAAVFATGFPVKRDYTDKSLNSFVKQVQSFKKIRMLGAAAIMGAMVAAGRIDAYREERIMWWDIAASAAIVKAAGGWVDINMLQDNQCICNLFANKTLYDNFKKLEG
ncbi:MAG: hypothetical protein IKK33_04150 [Lachnospiraceae bacterium]|nr:hypothetical protein [Lachnospiraceae bacterium]